MAAQFATDMLFECYTRYYLEGTTQRTNNYGSYFYRYDYPPCAPVPTWGVYHLAEIPFVLADPGFFGCTFDSEQDAFSLMMGNYWTNMAYSQKNPNQPVSNLTLWQVYNASNQNNMYFNSNVSMESNYRRHDQEE